MNDEEMSARQKWRLDNEASVFETNDHFTHEGLKADMEDIRNMIEWEGTEGANMLAILKKLEGAVSTLIEHTLFTERLRRRK